MRFTILFTTVIFTTSGAFASPLVPDIDPLSLLGVDLTAANHHGAPIAPWKSGAQPGWYYGAKPESPNLKLTSLATLMCKILLQCPQQIMLAQKLLLASTTVTPSPSDTSGYTQTFSNLTGATQASDYLTYGLVDTIADCQTICSSVSGCNFVNVYNDVNGKGGSTQLTCSLFSNCHTDSDADNIGGQPQPDGTVDSIADSNGFCKDCT